MKELLDHQYIQITFDKETNILRNIWTLATDDMSDEEYRHIAITQTEIIEKLQPKYWLVDIAQLRFTLVPETQEWADMVLFPRIIKAGVSFIAFVISEDLFAQISVEQLMDEKNVKTANFEIKYFDKQEDATQWLLSTSRH